jgi:serine/threonine protein kinase
MSTDPLEETRVRPTPQPAKADTDPPGNFPDTLPPRQNTPAPITPPQDPGDLQETLQRDTPPPVPGPVSAPESAVAGYRILSLLGRGGMGVVYKAEQVALRRVVALKMILHVTHAGTEMRERFRVEAEAVASLAHPNIVQIHECGERDGVPFFSLEFCDGGTLADRLKKPG